MRATQWLSKTHQSMGHALIHLTHLLADEKMNLIQLSEII